MTKISASILSTADRAMAIENINNSNIDYLHLDVMDGVFVANKDLLIADLNKYISLSKKPIDLHLMVTDIKSYLDNINFKNIAYITIHSEVLDDLDYYIDLIKSKEIKTGIAINPDTPVDKIIPYLDKIDLILIMSVNPGYGGQTFIDNTINKIAEINAIIKNRNIVIEVDGGINDQTIKNLINRVDIVVIGSYLFQGNLVTQLNNLVA